MVSKSLDVLQLPYPAPYLDANLSTHKNAFLIAGLDQGPSVNNTVRNVLAPNPSVILWSFYKFRYAQC